ncbi:MAG: 3-hydroxyacyl-CoA dehydrogenase [Chloroflexota bacterium]|nr:3-hydroxyacyl-CoA dehydrogenase [Chloroflexota bacterium]
MYIFKAAVVGAGAMGGGIAQVITYAGLPVMIKDIDEQQLELARKHVEGIYQSRVDKGKMTHGQMDEKLGLIEYTLNYDGFDDVDIIIEAVPEKMSVKQAVFKELDGVCNPDCIFASNTSALSIGEMGSATNRPHKVIGMHFFNPAHVMKLVEIIPSSETDQDTIDTVEQFTQELRKIPVIVQECPGFLVNRLLMPYLNEAVIALQEGAATTEEIDEAMGREGFGWPMGPFTLMDMLGNDVCYHVGEYLSSKYGDRMEAAVLFKGVFDAGRLGEKASAGWYDYPGGGHSAAVDEMIKKLQEEGTVKTGTKFSVDRLMMPMFNEAFMCVEEGIANVNDIDMACIAGIGMQVNKDGELVRMGPLEYADELGLDVVLGKLQALEEEFGPRFKSADILVKKVKAGDLGKKTKRGFKEYT